MGRMHGLLLAAVDHCPELGQVHSDSVVDLGGTHGR